MAEHTKRGGVTPQLAGRSHLEQIVPTIGRALEAAGVTLDDIDAIAVTNGHRR